MLNERDLKLKSAQSRKTLLRLIKACGAGHTGGDLSCRDILRVLYNRIPRVSPETFPTQQTNEALASRH
jgi:transketolase